MRIYVAIFSHTTTTVTVSAESRECHMEVSSCSPPNFENFVVVIHKFLKVLKCPQSSKIKGILFSIRDCLKTFMACLYGIDIFMVSELTFQCLSMSLKMLPVESQWPSIM